jgi:hypothetical protein
MRLDQIETIRKLAETHDFKGVPIPELCKMASRYAWLRAQLPKMNGLWIAHGIVGCLSCWNGEKADEAIDTAIKEKSF